MAEVVLTQIVDLSNQGYAHCSDQWQEQAQEVLTEVVSLLRKKGHGDICFLRPASQLCAESPVGSVIQQKFAHIFLMHLFDVSLYQKLREALFPEQVNRRYGHDCVPEWWPTSGNVDPLQRLASPFDYMNDLEMLSCSQPDQIHQLCPVVVRCLNCFHNITSVPNPPWHAFGALISLISETPSHRDLVMLLLLQEENVVATIYRTSVSASSPSAQRYSRFLLELLLSRPSILASLSAIYCFPGASRLIPLYTQHQHSAYELSANNPFRFILDLANQFSSNSEFKNATVITCISIACRRIEYMRTNCNLAEVYEKFNQISSVCSLSIVLAHFGCIVAQFILKNYGEREGTRSNWPSLKCLSRKALPPLAKPNYFFAEERPSSSNDVLATLQILDEFAELHRSLLYILKFITLIVSLELKELISSAPNEIIANKLISSNVQLFFWLIALGFKCGEKLARTELMAYLTEESLLEFSYQLIHTLDYKQSLIWTMFYDYGEDFCLEDMSLTPLIGRFFKKISHLQKSDSVQQIVADRLNRFQNRFGPLFADDDGWAGTRCNDSELSKDEYLFLYHEKQGFASEKTTSFHMKNVNNSFGGRQQSLHIDKFDKGKI